MAERFSSLTDGTTPIVYEAESDSVIHAKYANGIKLVMRLSSGKGVGGWIKGLGTCPVRFVGDEGWVEAGDANRIESSNAKLLEKESNGAIRDSRHRSSTACPQFTGLREVPRTARM